MVDLYAFIVENISIILELMHFVWSCTNLLLFKEHLNGYSNKNHLFEMSIFLDLI